MRITRKGFTLVELLIVVAILATLSAMMVASSSDAIDTANANAILGNLHTMKTEAYDMYFDVPAVAALTTITNESNIEITPADNTTDPATPAVTKTVAKILGERMGRIDLPTGYKIVGSTTEWYVVYTFQTNDSAQVKTILKDKANTAGLFGGATDATTFTAYYTGGTEAAVALRVR